MGTVLILLVMLIRRLPGRWVSRRTVSLMWMAPALRLCIPLALPNPLIDSLRPLFSSDADARPAAELIRRVLNGANHYLYRVVRGRGVAAVQVNSALSVTGWTVTGVWFAGVVITACIFALRYRRRKHKACRSRVCELDGAALQHLQEVFRKANIHRLPRVYLSDRLTDSIVFGFWKRVLILPMPWADDPQRHAEAAAYLKRHPMLWSVLRAFCCSLHWYHPLVWIAAELSRHDCARARKETLAVLLAGGKKKKQPLNAVFSLLLALLMLFSFATRESAPLPTVSHVPDVTWLASASPLRSDNEAIACARRFLESDFVAMDTHACTISAQLADAIWEIRVDNGSGLPVVLEYSQDGYLLSYNGTPLLGGILLAESAYAHPAMTQSVQEYLTAFMEALVPGPQWSEGSVTADRRLGDCRVLTIALRNA